MAVKYLDSTGALYIISKIKTLLTGKVDVVAGKGLSTNDYTTAEQTKLAGIAAGATAVTVDSALSSTSTNPVQNKVINTALATKAPLASPTFTGTPAAPTPAAGTNTTQLATTAFVASAIATAVSSTFKPSGSLAFASLPTPAVGVLGNVYNVTDAFTTTTSFVEGSGKSYPAGTNVVVIYDGSAYKFDVMAGFVDLSGYVLLADLVAITTTEIDAMFA
jgi:hypothetical protein